ncbi:MAG: acyltransferase [Betaproteobacteria bacterium]|nr:MAG: acyltransferase [Betaproteobacteria bacterium]
MSSPSPAPAHPVSPPARLPTLDGLRAIAILLVVPHNLDLIATFDGAQLVVAALHRGWIGVQLFFVLSGFLITGILLDARDAPDYYRSFFVRRALRIFPLYYATLLVLFVLLPALGLVPASFKCDAMVELSYWTYFSNWYGPFHQGPDPVSHFWSLALEEQFYLLWPFVIHRRSAGWVMRLCLAIAAASLLLRVVMLLAGTPAQAIYQFLVTRMDALALGGAAAAAFRVPSAASWTLDHRRFLLGASLLSLVGGAVLSRGYNFTHPVTLSLGFTFLAVGFALLVAAGVAADLLGAAGWPAALRWSFLRRVAKYSYAMYVLSVPLHFLVGKPVLSALGLAAGNSILVDLAYIIVGTALSFLAAAASFHLLEVHFLNLKDRFAPPLRAGV